jgi:hypothetical protein
VEEGSARCTGVNATAVCLAQGLEAIEAIDMYNICKKVLENAL